MPAHNTIHFPLWKFLNQPLFDPYYKAILNPRRFWYIYQIDVLERCLAKECPSPDHRRE